VTNIVVGVDGGGSKTRVIVADETGTEVIRIDGAASAVRPGRADHSGEVIASTVRDALSAAGLSHVRPGVICVGVAGAGREAERQALWRALVERGIADDIVVHADATVALDDAFGDGPGIVLIAGTGSVAFGRGPTGTLARCGGWGPVFGDEGGGAWMARRALSAATAAVDGREPETGLTGAIVTAAQVDRVEDLIAWAAEAGPAGLASLAVAVLQCAESGDLRANAVVSFAAEELALHVRALARTLFGDERATSPVALAGGLLSRRSPLRSRLEHRLKSAVPGAQMHPHEVEPARGAVRGALRAMGYAPGARSGGAAGPGRSDGDSV
jgi:glucosamine kinase